MMWAFADVEVVSAGFIAPTYAAYAGCPEMAVRQRCLNYKGTNGQPFAMCLLAAGPLTLALQFGSGAGCSASSAGFRSGLRLRTSPRC